MIKSEEYIFFTKEDDAVFRKIMEKLHFLKGDNPGHKLCSSESVNGKTHWTVTGTKEELAEVRHLANWML